MSKAAALYPSAPAAESSWRRAALFLPRLDRQIKVQQPGEPALESLAFFHFLAAGITQPRPHQRIAKGRQGGQMDHRPAVAHVRLDPRLGECLAELMKALHHILEQVLAAGW